MKRSPDKFHGLLLFNKPQGITSHDAVDRVRKILVQRGVGHAGTLDPAADGLLLLLVGRGTKAARFFSDLDKVYLAEITLGIESETYDGEGVVASTRSNEVILPDRATVESALAGFIGTISQQVPAYSAVHVDGERLYEKSRRGEEVTPPERTVHIDSIDILAFSADRLNVKVACSKGTYIRSLAHDLGRKLGCGAHLSGLRRISTGRFSLDEAYTLEELERRRGDGTLAEAVIPIDQALGFSCLTVGDEFGPLVRFGRRPTAGDIASVQGEFAPGDHIILKDPQGVLLAIGTAAVPSAKLDAKSKREILTYERVLA